MIDSDKWPEFGLVCNGGGGCVIVERVAGAIVIRDSKNPTQPGLVFSKKEYAAFRRRMVDAPWQRTWLRFTACLLRVVSAVLPSITA